MSGKGTSHEEKNTYGCVIKCPHLLPMHCVYVYIKYFVHDLNDHVSELTKFLHSKSSSLVCLKYAWQGSPSVFAMVTIVFIHLVLLEENVPLCVFHFPCDFSFNQNSHFWVSPHALCVVNGFP